MVKIWENWQSNNTVSCESYRTGEEGEGAEGLFEGEEDVKAVR